VSSEGGVSTSQKLTLEEQVKHAISALDWLYVQLGVDGVSVFAWKVALDETRDFSIQVAYQDFLKQMPHGGFGD